MICLIITDECNIHVMQFCGFAAITYAVMQASLCKESKTVSYIQYRSEGMDYGLLDCDISPLVEVKLLHAAIYFYDAPVIHFSTLNLHHQ